MVLMLKEEEHIAVDIRSMKDKEPKTKNVLPPARRSIVSAKKKLPSKKKNEFVLRRSPFPKLFLHRSTNLLFEDTDAGQMAIGTLFCDKTEDLIHPLTDDDVKEAMTRGFQYRILTEEELRSDYYKKDSKDSVTDDEKDDESNTHKASRHVTRVPLKAKDAEKLQRSLSSAIAATNIQAKDVADILGELQTRRSPSMLEAEDVDDESDFEDLEEEEEDE